MHIHISYGAALEFRSTFYVHKLHICDAAWIGHPYILHYKTQTQILQH
jgi:hypothetical protein